MQGITARSDNVKSFAESANLRAESGQRTPFEGIDLEARHFSNLPVTSPSPRVENMLRTLVLCRDQESVRAMTRVLKDLAIEVEECCDQNAGMKKIQSKRFNAIIADDAVRGAHDFLGRARDVPGCEKSVRILLASDTTAIAAAFQAGTQVVLYKPLTTERVRHGLRAVRNLMARESRRGSKRFPVEIPAKLSQGKLKNVEATVVDLSETGAALRGVQGVNASAHFSFEYMLPDAYGEVKGVAEIVWRDRKGICGVRFIDVAAQPRKRLSDWLKTQGQSPAAAPNPPSAIAQAR